jgi:hypothetical protein
LAQLLDISGLADDTIDLLVAIYERDAPIAIAL